MSTRAFNTGVSGTELTAAERAFVRAKRPWDLIPFKPRVETPIQVTVPVVEFAATRRVATIVAGLSIPVDGAADRAHPATTSATMIAQVIRSAVRFQSLLVSDDVPMMNALVGSIALAAGCRTTLHSNDNARLDALTARANTASA